MKLTQKEVLELFCSSIENAHALYESARETIFHSEGRKFPGLGLAELALEELGKSYCCLAMYSKCKIVTTDWSPFWKDWKNHDLKAHRAFFYEFFCSTRVEIDFSRIELNFPSARSSFSGEKEAAFYVDIDRGNRKIHRPVVEISDEECMRRLVSLLGLFNSACYVRDWMTSSESKDFKNAISDYAFTTLNTEMYTQDSLNVLDSMKCGNQDYDKGLSKIRHLLTEHLESQ